MKESVKHKRITLVFAPTIAQVAAMEIDAGGVVAMRNWLKKYRPDCLPPETDGALLGLLPHNGDDFNLDSGPGQARRLSDNELLVELAGRKCYNSFGLAAGRKSNREYIANTQQGDIPHASIMYHAKMSFFIAGVSRRVSHELIRNYVGADRDEEGSPSQESTRFTHHPGHFIVHPSDIELGDQAVEKFGDDMDTNYGNYLAYIDQQFDRIKRETGAEPKGLARKRVYEAASARLSHGCETSWIWTTNPIALAKLIHERENGAADKEITRLAKAWRELVTAKWPNLFLQPWMVNGPSAEYA